MLFTEAVARSFGGLEVLTGVTFTIGKGERAGLVGPNGAGKTTLLRILAGEDEPDKGRAWITSGEALGYLKQEAGLDSARPLLRRESSPQGTMTWTHHTLSRAERDHPIGQAIDGLRVVLPWATTMAPSAANTSPPEMWSAWSWL